MVVVVTVLVVALKDAPVLPEGMVMVGGTETTAGLLLERETRAPLLGAGPLSVRAP